MRAQRTKTARRRRPLRRRVWRPPWRFASCGRCPRRHGHRIHSCALRPDTEAGNALLPRRLTERFDRNRFLRPERLSAVSIIAGLPVLAFAFVPGTTMAAASALSVVEVVRDIPVGSLLSVPDGTAGAAATQCFLSLSDSSSTRLAPRPRFMDNSSSCLPATMPTTVRPALFLTPPPTTASDSSNAEDGVSRTLPTRCSTLDLYQTACVLVSVASVTDSAEMPKGGMDTLVPWAPYLPEVEHLLLESLLLPTVPMKPGSRDCAICRELYLLYRQCARTCSISYASPGYAAPNLKKSDKTSLVSSDARLRPLPWPSFHMVERYSVMCYCGRLWKSPWLIQIRQQIRSMLNDLAVPWNYMMPASLKVESVPSDGNSEAFEEIFDPDFGQVGPVASGLWWLILLRACGKITGDYALQERVGVQFETADGVQFSFLDSAEIGTTLEPFTVVVWLRK